MYEKIKLVIFSLLYLLLWGRFVLAIGDPIWTGGYPEDGWPFYADFQTWINYIYEYSGYLANPLWNLYYQFGEPWKNSWFPILPAADAIKYLITQLQTNAQLSALPFTGQVVEQLQAEWVQRTFQGAFTWFTVIAIIIVRILRAVIDRVYEFLKNLIWNVLIEMSFSRKKQAAYQQKLESRAKDLMKLKVEYRNLSKEASQLSEAVVTDELTKVFNKRFFIEKVKHEFDLAKSQQINLSLVMMDIDHFKKLNDTHGHMMGDVVLKAVAGVAKRMTPKNGFCCRFGGEEFSIILPGYTHEMAIQILEPMRAEIEKLTFKENADVHTSISMGLITASFTNPDAQMLQDFEDFVKLADDELYRAKLGGRNRINYNILK